MNLFDKIMELVSEARDSGMSWDDIIADLETATYACKIQREFDEAKGHVEDLEDDGDD